MEKKNQKPTSSGCAREGMVMQVGVHVRNQPLLIILKGKKKIFTRKFNLPSPYKLNTHRWPICQIPQFRAGYGQWPGKQRERLEMHRGPWDSNWIPTDFSGTKQYSWTRSRLLPFHVGEKKLLLKREIYSSLTKFSTAFCSIESQGTETGCWAAPAIPLSLPIHVLLLFTSVMTLLEHKTFRRHFQALLHVPVPMSCQLVLGNPGIRRQAHTSQESTSVPSGLKIWTLNLIGRFHLNT